MSDDIYKAQIYECGSADAYENKLRQVRQENAELRTENQTLREKVQELEQSNSHLFNIDQEFQRTQTMLKTDNEKLQARITALREALLVAKGSLDTAHDETGDYHYANATLIARDALTADDKAASE